MSTTALLCEPRRATLLSKASDYLELTKPRIGVLVLVTVAVGAFIGRCCMPDGWLLFHTLVGTAFVAASASAFNQWWERQSDRLMARTALRPLPDGRLSALEVVCFGMATIVLGALYLTYWVNGLTALLGLLTWFIYAWVYTPLKTRTPANTFVGAISGALPVLMGWAAVGASFNLQIVGLKAAALFLIVFFWQFPHFMAIAWIYRQQYAAAGMQMLPVVDPSGRRAGAQALTTALMLLPVSLVPAYLHVAGLAYALGAVALGLIYIVSSYSFLIRPDEISSRRLLRVSLVYLPSLLLLMMLTAIG
ncbi:MAG TPA: heme o synthase [Pirellulales bacterium]|jgi:protoheme IX farnesyltransferase|nr:heme o synthase [Pirellulales bacterium]